MLKEVEVKKVSDYRIEGFAHQISPDVWSTELTRIIRFIL